MRWITLVQSVIYEEILIYHCYRDWWMRICVSKSLRISHFSLPKGFGKMIWMFFWGNKEPWDIILEMVLNLSLLDDLLTFRRKCMSTWALQISHIQAFNLFVEISREMHGKCWLSLRHHTIMQMQTLRDTPSYTHPHIYLHTHTHTHTHTCKCCQTRTPIFHPLNEDTCVRRTTGKPWTLCV